MQDEFQNEIRFKIGEVLKNAFVLYRDNFILLFLIAVFAHVCDGIYIPSISAKIMPLFLKYSWLFGVYSFLKTILYGFSTAVLTYVVFQILTGGDVSFTNVLLRMKRIILKYLLGYGLFMLMFFMGMLFLILPGIYLMIVFAFADQFILFEHSSIFGSFRESFKLVKGHFWKMFLLFCVVTLFSFLSMIANGLSSNYVLGMILNMLIFPWSCAVSVFAFVKLKEIKAQGTYVREVSLDPKKDLKEIIIVGLILALVIAGIMFLTSFFSKRSVCSLNSRQQYVNTSEYKKPKLMSMDANPVITEEDAFIVYMPSKIDLKKKYPLVVALSPNADGQSMLNALQNAAENNKWIVYASKKFKNNISMGSQFWELNISLDWVLSHFPIDDSQVYAAGFSGGGMGSHAFSYDYPDLIKGVIVNTGMMHEYYFKGDKAERYPREKKAVFLASPTDFRYDEMKRDRKFLEGLAWDVKWIEFGGGHKIAPASSWQESLDWLDDQMSRKVNKSGDDRDVSKEEKQPKRNGWVKDYYDDGSLLSEYYMANGKRQGEYITYYQSGAVWAKGSYVDDKKNGLFVVLNEDGSKQTEASYLKGFYDGVHKDYDEDGDLDMEIEYLAGVKISKKKYNKKGYLKESVNYKDGKKHGVKRYFQGDEVLQWEMNYQNGKLEGITKMYDEDGRLLWLMNYSNDKRDGKTLKMNEKGEVELEFIYEEGKLKNSWQLNFQRFGLFLNGLFENKKNQQEKL